jgi:chromosome segregation ATPase
MIEPIMFFGIGFLVAALIGLVVIPLVHGRAVRLTMRRLEAATPLSMAEIQADKDQLRAEYAMSTRRLEMSVEQLKGKTTSQLAEIGKKGDAINRLKIELGEKTAAIFSLEARDKALRDQLRATEEEVTVKTGAQHDAERALSAKEAELEKFLGELDERSGLVDEQRMEIVALKTQIEALNDRLAESGNEVKAAEDRHGEQSRVLNQREFELKQLQNELDAARKIESDLRAAITELEGRSSATATRLSAEIAQLSADLNHAVSDRDRLTRELAAMKSETEETWASERVENGLLRDRINDVAVEVARLASALEGPNSPIDALLAAESKRDHGIGTTHGTKFAGAPSTNGDLADRIRALQNHASRVPVGDKPTSRN